MSSPMFARDAALTYQRDDVHAADPLRLVARVFDVMSRHLARARTAMANGDPACMGKSIDRVQHCLGTLQSNLDMERGEQVAVNLDRLYAYLQRRVSEAHLKNDDAAFEEVIGHVNELASAWWEVVRRGETRQSALATAATP